MTKFPLAAEFSTAATTRLQIFVRHLSQKQHYRVNITKAFLVHYLEALWYKSFITAVCNSGCGELGRCVQPGICECPRGFQGQNCDTGEFL